MRAIILSMLLCLPMAASAEYLDVIKFELKEGCTFAQHQEITADFNKWGEQYGYRARVAMPLNGDDLNSLYWLGETADAAAFGKAWDTWRDALSDPGSTPAELWARFEVCSTNVGRWGYDLY